MKIISVLFGLTVVLMLSNCGSSESALRTSHYKAAVDSLIENREFRVVNQWALPTMSSSMMELSSSGIMGPGNSGQRIDLSGSTSFLEIKGDSVRAILPYFGVRQMGGGYNSDGEGIQFDQVVENISFDDEDAKDRYVIKFRANNGSESFELILYIYSNKKSSLLVNSSQRDVIRYEGTIRELPKKDNP